MYVCMYVCMYVFHHDFADLLISAYRQQPAFINNFVPAFLSYIGVGNAVNITNSSIAAIQDILIDPNGTFILVD